MCKTDYGEGGGGVQFRLQPRSPQKLELWTLNLQHEMQQMGLFIPLKWIDLLNHGQYFNSHGVFYSRPSYFTMAQCDFIQI